MFFIQPYFRHIYLLRIQHLREVRKFEIFINACDLDIHTQL